MFLRHLTDREGNRPRDGLDILQLRQERAFTVIYQRRVFRQGFAGGHQHLIGHALAHLSDEQKQGVAQGLTDWAWALEKCRDVEATAAKQAIAIVTGYRPGMIGRIAQMHGEYYAKHYGFGHFFESKVASGLAEFSGRLEKPRNQVWLAVQGEQIVGSVAIDGEDLGNNQAHLRWFILDDSCRGSGIGRRLLNEALAFCDSQGFAAVQLWTFSGLNAARRLYESFGFTLHKEWQGDQWGRMMTEQQFSRQQARAE